MTMAGLIAAPPTPRAVPIVLLLWLTAAMAIGATGFLGADRYLEISIRRTALEPFTTLSPRQQLTSTPYAIRSLASTSADTAANATQLGGIDAARFIQSDTGGNVSLSGNLTVSGTTSFDTVNAANQFNLGGQRVLASDSSGWLTGERIAASAKSTPPVLSRPTTR